MMNNFGMKKIVLKIFAIVILCSIQLQSRADGGMWIPMLLEQLNQKEMQTMGMRITAEDIYSINHSSLKDAILLFGGGCTAEIVSDQGLILTNHHCGYSNIQAHSTLQNDYLTNGFWAMKQSEELSNPGLTVTLLIRMEDVTAKVLEGVTNNMTEAKRAEIIKRNSKKIEAEAEKGTHYKASTKPFYYGNQFYMFVTETFKDVRLVGAPPSNIGKFGGDTDNWMWPRHTGDFSIFRIYVDKDNNPAEYSADNVPYKPKKHLSISLKGEEKGDFTFVFGYPGRTQQFLTSHAVDLLSNYENPARIKMRDKRLEIIRAEMETSREVRIQYSAKYASIANFWKKMIGENKGIKRLDAVNKKKELEQAFNKWLAMNNEKQKQYGGLLPDFENTYKALKPYAMAYDYFTEAGIAPEIIKYAYAYKKLVDQSKDKNLKPEEFDKTLEAYKKGVDGSFKNYNLKIDKKIFTELMRIYYKDCDKAFHPEAFAVITNKYKGDLDKYANDVFEQSFLSTPDKVNKFLNDYKASKYSKIEKDPAYILAISLYDNYYNKVQNSIITLNDHLDSLYRIYSKALMEMQPDKRFFPDANSTLRIAYGKVNDYLPHDGVKYEYNTTIKGIMEKEDSTIYDYVVEPKLKDLYNKKDYGRYATKTGDMQVAFIATNHTTGGNSGSPVLNADGQLIGINFDRNWEGTMSDVIYDPDQCRNISLDIRYCLFIIDKFAGAKRLVDEMTIVN